MKKQYINDLIKEKGLTKADLFNDNFHSIIAGGIGMGKSTFTCKELAKLLGCKSGEILLVAPLTAIVNQSIFKGQAVKQELLQAGFFEMDNVTVCTFNKLNSLIQKREALPPQIKYVVFDEAHNLITAESYAEYCSFFLKWLEDNDINVLFLTVIPQT
ncbi:hypothetical protein CON34_22145 [Bacillus thuringiensis]|uniref:DEAD/DEAH box helicase family protein n=1 Tax=Bacillus thuringiensis TaxID=1428 RepID=UPI000BEC77C0|nr:DEAD/DEAH box helicase family protein [Bacillus thuringiensis]MED4447215.1 DEAD/DEAH box helicase family protein [Bacillus cereus]PEB46339.1 hypothetical protein COM82_17635 [Bacillus thuringiensis]PED24230.1 hypothetical protein CON34_22145 [Bacillus thuringiensis]